MASVPRPRSSPLPRTSIALALALCVVLAGCGAVPPAGPTTDADGSGGPPDTTSPPSTSAPSTTATPTRTPVPTTDEGYYRSYEFEATTVTGPGIARAVALTREAVAGSITFRSRTFVRDLFADRTAVRVVIGESPDGGRPGPFENGTVVRTNGTFYRLNGTVVGRHEGPSYGVELVGPLRAEHHEDYARAEREAVDFAALSPEDRHVFTFAVPGPDERDAAVHHVGYTWVFPEGDDPGDSRLVDGDRHYVRYEGDLYRVEAEDRGERDVRYRVRYDLTPVADSASAFAEDRLDAYVTPLNESNLSAPARTVLVEAVRSGPVEWEGRTDAPAGYQAAARWVYDHPPAGSTAFVRYRGSLYEVTVRKVVE